MSPTFRVIRSPYSTWQVIAHRYPQPQMTVFETGNKAKAEAVEEFLSSTCYFERLQMVVRDSLEVVEVRS